MTERKQVLRTPEECFIEVPDFDYAPNYVEDLRGYEGLRMHLVDEGPARAGEVFVCLHGEPTWSYLYRKMLPTFLASKARVVVPDFFGFGRSDKPADDRVYTFDFHRDSLIALIEQRDLRGITLVCQDWGGILGLTLPMVMPDRFDRLVILNTSLAMGQPLGEGFLGWRQFVRDNPDFDIAWLMRRACPTLTSVEAGGYAAPFPDARYRAGVRAFPEIVPVTPDAPGAEISRQALAWLRDEWNRPVFTAVGLQDPVLGLPVMERLSAAIGAPPPLAFEEGGHFLQEVGSPVAEAALIAFAG